MRRPTQGTAGRSGHRASRPRSSVDESAKLGPQGVDLPAQRRHFVAQLLDAPPRAQRLPLVGGPALGPGGGFQRGRLPAEQLDPARLLLPGRPFETAGEGFLPVGQQPQHLFDLGQRIEAGQAFGPATELADRLWPPQHEHTQHSAVLLVEAPNVVEHVAVLLGPLPGAEHDARRTLLPQPGEGLRHVGVAVAHDRVPVGGLVGRGDEGVEGQGVDVRRGQLLLEQAAEHPRLGCGELHRPGSVRRFMARLGRRPAGRGVRCGPESPGRRPRPAARRRGGGRRRCPGPTASGSAPGPGPRRPSLPPG